MNDQSSAPESSLVLRFARWLARTLVDASPAESRSWGQALASETQAIQEPFDALRWALGGFRLFARAWTLHAFKWLSLPVGSGTTTTLGTGPAPRRSRLFTFALLSVTAVLFSVPQGRQAVRTIIYCWPGFDGSKRDERALQAIAAKAERSQDARTLAFVALAERYSRPLDAPKADQIADRAVELDPSLAWIYAGVAWPFGFLPKHNVWLSRMKAADPENGMVDLYFAGTISPQAHKEAYEKLARKGVPDEREIEASLGRDSEWLSHMEAALRAPRCESYDARLIELFREGYQKHPGLSPLAFLRSFIRGVRDPEYQALWTYVSILVRRGKEANSPDERRKAAEGLVSVEQFVLRLNREFPPDSPKGWGATMLTFEVLTEQKELFEYHGLTQDAAAVQKRISEVGEAERKRTEARRRVLPLAEAQGRSDFYKGYTVHGLLLMAMVLSFWFTASLLLFEFKLVRKLRIEVRLQRIGAFAVDYCPVILILDGIALMTLFQPYARVFRALVSGNVKQSDEFSLNFYGLITNVPFGALPIFTPYCKWLILILALSGIALFILARGFLRVVRR